MKKIIATAFALLTLGALTGCSEGTAESPAERTVFYVQLDDGRVLECIYIQRGGSCNWDNPVNG